MGDAMSGPHSSFDPRPVLRFALLESPPPPLLRRGVSPQLVFGFGNQLGDFDGTTVSINRNEGQITRVCVSSPAGEQVFRFDADTDLHRRSSDLD